MRRLHAINLQFPRSLWPPPRSERSTEVQARQTLNAELALQLAARAGLHWLLHIDIDELFWTPDDSIQSHFAMLRRCDVYQMTYTNHEGVPEAPLRDYADCFTAVTLFKRHFMSLPLSGDARGAMDWWRRRTYHGQYMLGYDCGKSVVRVGCGALPRNVHAWRLPPPLPSDSSSGSAPRSRTALADPRNMDMGAYLPLPEHCPCILHYINCGWGWYRDKYALLARFGDAWFGGKLPIAPSFHLDSRDVLWQREGSVAAADGSQSAFATWRDDSSSSEVLPAAQQMGSRVALRQRESGQSAATTWRDDSSSTAAALPSIVGKQTDSAEHAAARRSNDAGAGDEAPPIECSSDQHVGWTRRDKALRRIYETQVEVCAARDRAQVERSLSAGVCMRILGPRGVIEGARRAHASCSRAQHDSELCTVSEDRNGCSLESEGNGVAAGGSGEGSSSAVSEEPSVREETLRHTTPVQSTSLSISDTANGIRSSAMAGYEKAWLISCAAKDFL
ncbi:hypothetical protein JKP88DRAFT_264407 [Tribonema minus]|uniref:Glycosyltransferase family 92 protein n=1 Tax=Tribonema minus TaxID=303371 RepID=A0A835YS67_9STRA|nr:hypothetical protein JKP88DRAFT_264407 [Tribonema minus]